MNDYINEVEIEKEDLSFSGIVKTSATNCGIKKGQEDLALIYSSLPISCIAQFTQNGVRAYCIDYNESILKENHFINGIIINSGNANAVSGKEGKKANDEIIKTLKNTFGKEKRFLILSTGIIGIPLPYEKIISKIPLLQKELKKNHPIRYAIMTTDKYPKAINITFKINHKEYRLSGVAKGAGMIYPDMGTMFAFFSTDFPLPYEETKQIFTEVLDSTFNAISVDGDTSTNDAALLLFKERNESLTSEEKNIFSKALYFVAEKLALMIVEDGEGTTKVVHLKVEGENKELCKKVAKNIANSILVKSAIAGGGANWGRIFASAGKNRTKIDISKASLYIGNYIIYDKEKIFSENIPKANQYIKINKNIKILLSLDNKKTSSYTIHFSDLSIEYLKFNMELS